MKKRLSAYFALFLLAVLLPGCGGQENAQYSVTYLTLFDTVTTITGRADSEAEFQETAAEIYDQLLVYHQLFDIYQDYEGLNNLKTVNDNAGIAPVEVDEALIDLLLFCRQAYDFTGGKVNAAMGSVLSLWHDARTAGLDDPENAVLPSQEALEQASQHISFDAIIIDQESSTVYISDPETQLDVGAVAKGWVCQKVSEGAPSGLLISLGGNICATGPKDESGTAWVIGIQDPDDGDSYLHTLSLTGGSAVTSGDYQRTYTVGGISYHHIIDPDTLYPGVYWRSVTILCADSGLADALSTALFLMPQEAGQALLDACDAEAMWVDAQGNILYSSGFAAYIRS